MNIQCHIWADASLSLRLVGQCKAVFQPHREFTRYSKNLQSYCQDIIARVTFVQSFTLIPRFPMKPFIAMQGGVWEQGYINPNVGSYGSLFFQQRVSWVQLGSDIQYLFQLQCNVCINSGKCSETISVTGMCIRFEWCPLCCTLRSLHISAR